MPGTIIINMPMKPYLSKFLLKKYGPTHKVSFYSLLGQFLMEILDKQYRKDKTKVREKSYYPLVVPKTFVEKFGFDMPPRKMKRFEDMLIRLFKNELESHVDITVEYDLYISENDKKYKLDVMKAIKQFLNFYNINEDDLKLESLYRDYKRQKKELGQEKPEQTQLTLN